MHKRTKATGMRHTTLRHWALGLLACLLSTAWVQAAELPRIQLQAGNGVLNVKVASDKAQRSLGLMNTPALAESKGMLFVYPAPAYFCMWMKNTLIPLSVAFIDAQGLVINIEDMAPQTEANHCTRRNATYALEVNRGWFAKHGVTVGSQIIGLEQAPQAEY